jgi:predicted ATPase
MERIYLDNFRGFSDQFIEMRNVNFLVGENSSGKSSVLLALNTISYPGFWFNLDFYAGDTQVHSFEDLVSVEAQDKTYFKIGFINDDNRNISYLFEFKNKTGKPIISSGMIEKEQNLFVFCCEKNQIKYELIKNKKLPLDMLVPLSRINMSKIETLLGYSDVIPPLIILQICEYAINNNKKNGFQGMLPVWDIASIAPIRSKPKKTYDEPGTLENPEGDHIPYILRRILGTKSDLSQKINGFGELSGLFKNINIKEYDKADDAPFRMNFVLNREPINVVNIGYGVSQVLPILYNIFAKNSTIITIQQPEVHLHPKAQAAIGNVFFDLSIGKGRKKFIVETHSDYIIDRFRQNQKRSLEKSLAHVLFFLREKGINRAFSINIDDNGNYDNNQPKEFREFFIKEELENLGL